MLAGGVNEMISHFAGFLRIFDEPARSHQVYDDGADLLRPSAGSFSSATARSELGELEELPSSPMRIPLIGSDDPTMAHGPFGKLHLPPGVPARLSNYVPHAEPVGRLRDPAEVGDGVIRHSSPTIHKVGEPGQHHTPAVDVSPEQHLVQTAQANDLHDCDTIVMVQGSGVEFLHTIDGAVTLAGLIDKAEAVAPAGLAPASAETADLVAWADAHAARDTAASGSAMPPDAAGSHMPNGLYVDGTMQPPGTDMPLKLPELPDPVPSAHDGLHHPGLDAQTGSNLALNTALILDDDQRGAFVVRGDVHEVDAIVQTNVLLSNSQVQAASSTAPVPVSVDGNEAHSAARIEDHATGSTVIGHFNGPTCAIDWINGNFYDVKGCQQVNNLVDNDVVVQGSFTGYYTVATGANGLGNFCSIEQLDLHHYDLIVVDGNYHAANLIFQTNVLLTDSIVLSLSMRDDLSSQSVSCGDNSLQNSASIDHYGSTDYHPITSTLGDALNTLEGGRLDGWLAQNLPNSGSDTINVLWIRGDYYDINYLSQINVVTNIDTIVQYSPNTGTLVAPDGLSTTFVQNADTGDNHLANAAAIATVGTTSDFQFIGGERYDDAIIIQANIVDTKSDITVGNVQALAPEVVAFTGLPAPTEQTDPSKPVVVTPAHMSDDLFHGVLS